MDLYFQGLAALNKGVNPENMVQARSFFKRAVALDPNNLDALLGVGRVDYTVGGAFLSNDRDARLAAAEATIAKVLSQRPNDALAHEIMGGVLIRPAARPRDRRIGAGTGVGSEFGDSSWRHRPRRAYRGSPRRNRAHEKEALRLSPRDSFAWRWLHFVGAAKMTLGADEEAVALFRRSIEINRTIPLTHFFLAAALANLDRLEEAQSEVKAGLALDPGFTSAAFKRGAEADPPLEGMRKAGVPEG